VLGEALRQDQPLTARIVGTSMLPPALIQDRPNKTYGWPAIGAPITKCEIAIDVAAAGDR
jgi:hypothetical protein